MNNTNLFLKTLKRIEYLEADILDDSDYDCFFAEKELVPFFDVFCSLNENNVLTTEEIKEYSALTSGELEEIEIFSRSLQDEKTYSESEQRKEAYYLQEHLSHIENHNKSLERQIELYKQHEQHLIEEKESCLKLLVNAKKKFQMYEMNKIPVAEDEFVSGLKSVLDAVENLESLLVHSDASKSRLPSSDIFKDLVKKYLDEEDKIIESVKPFLESNFMLQGENNELSFICSEKKLNEELLKESVFLQKTVKKTFMDEVITEKEFLKSEAKVKYLENVESSEFNCHPLLLKNKLDDALKMNENLNKREDELITHISDVIHKYISARFAEVALRSTEETLKCIQYLTNILELPMEILISQRSRLEVFSAFLCKHSEELQNLKQLIQKINIQLKEEQENLRKRKDQTNSKRNEILAKENVLYPETSIYLSLYKILAMFDDPRIESLQSVTLQDVMQKVKKFVEENENMKRREKEKLNILEVLEKQTSSMEKLLKCTDKGYLNWHELEHAMNVSLNNLDIKLTSLERRISECSQDLDQKQKLLERKGNLCFARNLYVYALLNKDLFKKCIDNIKVAIENSSVYYSK